jgi:hypothetical protein
MDRIPLQAENFDGSGRYIRSNLKVGTDTGDATAAIHLRSTSLVLPIRRNCLITNFNGRWSWFQHSNIRTKISYDNDQINNNFIPANLNQNGFDFYFNKYALNVERETSSSTPGRL